MKIVFESINYSLNHLATLVDLYPEVAPLTRFIEEWEGDSAQFEMQTSGSTGTPKTILVTRDQIHASVVATAQHLGLQSNECVLLSLDPKYIASLMMVARAFILNMDLVLVRPSGNPLNSETVKCDFASFVPFQIYKMIEEGNISQLKQIRNVLIGGAPLTKEAFGKLATFDSNIYLTYGMTETVSHIALMRVRGKYEDAHFRVLDGVTIGVDADSCLWIQGAVTDHVLVQTNDIVDLQGSMAFRWLGRRDLVINSGGIKIQPEQLESLIAEVLEKEDWQGECFISSQPDQKLESKCVLIVSMAMPLALFETIQKHIAAKQSKYHTPRQIWVARQWAKTDSGKIQRKKCELGAKLIF